MPTGTEQADVISNDPEAAEETIDARGGDDVIISPS